MYLTDLRQSAEVGWEKIEGLLMLLLMLSRQTMANGHAFSEMVLWSHIDMDLLSYMDMNVLSELINYSEQLVQFD